MKIITSNSQSNSELKGDKNDLLQFINHLRFTQHNELIRISLFFLIAVGVFLSAPSSDLYKPIIIGGSLLIVFMISSLRNVSDFPLTQFLQYYFLLIIFIPESVSYISLFFACVFGLVFGDLVFGGRGFSFTHPVLCSLVYLFISYPELDRTISSTLVLGALFFISLVILVWYRCIDIKIIISSVLMIAFLKLIYSDFTLANLPNIAAMLCFLLLLCDPASTPSNQTGRILYGLLLGFLIYIFSSQSISFREIVFAGFFANITAPLLDWVTLNLSNRKFFEVRE